jgi:hypothetical protein
MERVKERLNELGVPYSYVGMSDRPGKKIKIVINGKVIHFGSKNSVTFLDHGDEQKRAAYKARHSKILLKDGTRAIDKIYSPAWLSFFILW